MIIKTSIENLLKCYTSFILWPNALFQDQIRFSAFGKQILTAVPVWGLLLYGCVHCTADICIYFLCATYRRGLIEAIGFDADIRAAYPSATFDDVIDATDKCVIPGQDMSVCPSFSRHLRRFFYIFHYIFSLTDGNYRHSRIAVLMTDWQQWFL